MVPVNFDTTAGTITENGDETLFTPFDPNSVGAVDIIYAISDGAMLRCSRVVLSDYTFQFL